MNELKNNVAKKLSALSLQSTNSDPVVKGMRMRLAERRNELRYQIEQTKQMKQYLEEDTKSVEDRELELKRKNEFLTKEINRLKNDKARIKENCNALKIKNLCFVPVLTFLKIKHKRFHCPEGKKIYLENGKPKGDRCNIWECPAYNSVKVTIPIPTTTATTTTT